MDHKRETETANLKRHKPYKPQSDMCPPARIHILSLPKHPPTGDQVVKCPNYRELAFKLLQRAGWGLKRSLPKIILHKIRKYWLLRKYTEMDIRGKGRSIKGCLS